MVVTDSAATPAGATATLPLAIQPPIRPLVTGISPASGRTTGGTLVTLTGKHLDRALRVTVGGIRGPFTAAPGGATLTLTTPHHSAGTVRIVVFGAGTTMSADSFTYHR